MERRQGTRYDFTLVITIFILTVLGLVLLYSSSAYNGDIRFHDRLYYVKKQLFATLLGLLCMIIAAEIDETVLKRLSGLMYMSALGLSLAVIFVGEEYNGSKRWLSFGPLSFQPSEYTKIAVIIFLSTIIADNMGKMSQTKTLIIIMVMILPAVGLVGTANLSTAIIILAIGAVLIFVASPKYVLFFFAGGVGMALMAVFLAMESYRLERLSIWRHPEKYEKGYQTLQGLYAIGSGGLFGRGTGQSIQKLGFVPEAQNDMIFSIVCEEWGFFGATLLLTVFLVMIWRFFVIATRSRDIFGTMIVTGAMTHISVQLILNIAVVSNAIPNTGITLPFVSFGGTSALFLLFEMGLVLNVSKSAG